MFLVCHQAGSLGLAEGFSGGRKRPGSGMAEAQPSSMPLGKDQGNGILSLEGKKKGSTPVILLGRIPGLHGPSAWHSRANVPDFFSVLKYLIRESNMKSL